MTTPPNKPPQTSPDFIIRPVPTAWSALRDRAGLASDEALAAALHVSSRTVNRALAPNGTASARFVGHTLAAFPFASFDRMFKVEPS